MGGGGEESDRRAKTGERPTLIEQRRPGAGADQRIVYGIFHDRLLLIPHRQRRPALVWECKTCIKERLEDPHMDREERAAQVADEEVRELVAGN